MTAINNPGATHHTETSNLGVHTASAAPTRVTYNSSHETKAFYKTSEFVVYIVATVGVLLASYLVQATDGHGDYFQADKAWLYIAILSVGYMVSRGLAKSGTRHRDDA
jgi:hypothetical protein